MHHNLQALTAQQNQLKMSPLGVVMFLSHMDDCPAGAEEIPSSTNGSNWLCPGCRFKVVFLECFLIVWHRVSVIIGAIHRL